MPSSKVHLWCLFDLSKQKLHEGLLFDEVRAIVTSREADELSQWRVWRDDWQAWKEVIDVPGLDEPLQRKLSRKPPPVPDDFSGNRGPQGFLEDDESLSVTHVPKEGLLNEDSLSNSFMVRDKKRYKKRFAVAIEVSGKVFNTFTRDVSVGGVNVEDLIPDWITGYFKIRLSKPNDKQKIELQCCLVEGQPPHERYRLMILPLQNHKDERNLERWFAAI